MPLRRPLASLLAAALLTACGGGGGGGAAPPAPATLTYDNAPVITAEVLRATGLADAVSRNSALEGAGARSMALGTAAVRRQALALVEQGGPTANPAASYGPETFPCTFAGTVRVSAVIADLETIGTGDWVRSTYTDCDEGDGIILNGTVRLEFLGTPVIEPADLDLQLDLTGFAITEDGMTYGGDGDLRLQVEDTGSLLVTTLSGDLLNLSEGNENWLLDDYVITLIEDQVTPGNPVVTAVTGTLGGNGFEGTVDFDTLEGLVNYGSSYPASGELLITGAGDATIRVLVINAASLRLDLDLDGNGTPEDSRVVNWADLLPAEYLPAGLVIWSAQPPLP